MLPIDITSRPLDDFRAPTTRILFGERLKDVQQIEASITQHGLLNPLIVMKRGEKLIIVDGKKRLAALRRMRFAGNLPRSLVKVPYVLIGQSHNLEVSAMSLLTNRERFDEVTRLRGQGMGLIEIASTLYISKQCVKDLLGVALLSPRLRQAYFGGTISTQQARAFATVPSVEAQDQLIIALGPFANAPEILKAIQDGETVINMDEDNVIILPSRRPLTPYHAGPRDLAA